MANPKHLEILKQGVDVWNEWREQNPKTIPNLQGARLKRADLQGANLQRADFQGANLQGADLWGARLKNTNFQAALLRGADLQGADLQSAKLLRATLQNANLKYSNLWSAKLQEANLQSADCQGVKLWRADLQQADLQQANLQEADCHGANFQGSKLSDIKFQGANLQEANFQKAYCFGANLRKADLREADFQFAYLRRVDLGEANCQFTNFQEADFLGATLQGTDLQFADLQGANLERVKLKEVRLQQANLQFAKLREADFQKADVQGANFQLAELQRAKFWEVDFRKAKLQMAKLQGAILALSRVMSTNFNSTNLTGVCIAQWTTDAHTDFTDVQCDYIYLGWDEEKKYPTDRRPHDPDEIFAPGDFARLMEQARDTVDLIFGNGIDWQAFLTSFQTLQVAGEHGDLSIQNIGRKSDGSFVISVETPPTADKAAIERDFQAKYDAELKRLETSYQEKLQLKDEQIAIYREQSTNMTDIVKMLANRPITVPVNVEASAVAENQTDKSIQQTFQGPVYGVAGAVQGDQIINAQTQQSLSEAAAEIQTLLQQLAATNPTSTTIEQMQVAMKAVERIESDATLKEKVIAAARGGMLEGLRANPIGAIVAGAIEGWLEA